MVVAPGKLNIASNFNFHLRTFHLLGEDTDMAIIIGSIIAVGCIFLIALVLYFGRRYQQFKNRIRQASSNHDPNRRLADWVRYR